jgi:hypothetical protein
MIKNKHKSGINISIGPKIMINLVKVHIGIICLFPEVELKNIFTFCYKNHQSTKGINTR